jgi:CheY-like chemotaxis protein
MNNLGISFQGKSILVAEDDDILRDTVGAEFEMQGARVFSAADGRAAFNITIHEKIDGIVSDIRMPGGDGIELLKHVKEVSCSVPVLMFMTGFADLSISEAYQLGAEAILRKPFNLDELLEAAGRMLLPKMDRWNIPSSANLPGYKIERTYSSLGRGCQIERTPTRKRGALYKNG